MREPAVSSQREAVAGPDRMERVLGWGSLAMLAIMLVALARGRAEWNEIPWAVWPHLATVALALGLTPAILWRRRGDPLHRQLGYAWVTAMASTAVVSFAIRMSNQGGLSFIHLLSVWVLIQVPIIVLSARAGNWRRHRVAVRGMVIGALLIAGFFTLPFDRLLGQWLLG
jgi:uncharacterized membrane protein